jgi:hypothetical protein
MFADSAAPGYDAARIGSIIDEIAPSRPPQRLSEIGAHNMMPNFVSPNLGAHLTGAQFTGTLCL